MMDRELAGRFDNIDKRFDHVDKRFDHVDERLDRNEGTLSMHHTEIFGGADEEFLSQLCNAESTTSTQ